MNIKRIDSYNDDRFKDKVLKQHGAYLIDDLNPCEFFIIKHDTAIIYFYDYSRVDPIIDAFRFYSSHITRFLDRDKNLIKEFEPTKLTKTKIIDLQPSQFYVDKSKVKHISSWANSIDKLLIPVFTINNEKVVVDGHTRLYVALKLGLDYVYTYENKVGEEIIHFVNEAKRRGVRSINDIELVSHLDYVAKWDRFCDELFEQLEEKKIKSNFRGSYE